MEEKVLGQRPRGRRAPVEEAEGSICIAIGHLSAPPPPRDNYQARMEASVGRLGILHPLTVRELGDARYLVLDGARRLAAARACGITGVLCRLIDREEAALTDEIRAAEGDPFIQAETMAALIERCHLTQTEAALRLGMSQSTVANKLRLLKLSDEERELILSSHLTERHARALLKIADPDLRLPLLRKVISENLNVAQTEKAVSDHLTPPVSQSSPPPHAHPRMIVRDLRIFYNTIEHAVQSIARAGVEITQQRRESSDAVEFLIRIPKNPPSRST